VAVVATGATPEYGVAGEQFFVEAVEDLEHDLARIERAVTVGGRRTIADAGAALIAEAGEVPLYLLRHPPAKIEVHVYD
jgi:hypothetical protein